ncbi:MAG: PEP/pyruvate-binding domain-containing protein [Muribaculaceae bacterium]|nr:PEP/pyruvate-binding domain-containing protein [Muribaculaceae bacterium]MDY5118412.1 PEP/pyruvate-binding domain-containing protein [Muribaculaceae bacterium]
MMNETSLSQLYLRDTAFQDLMQKRIFNVLLIATPYDAFMMEDDGRVEEQIYFEYVRLNLSSPPRFVQVNDFDTAAQRLSEKQFDLIIAMPGIDISETFEKAKELKRSYPDIPYVVLTPFSREVSRRLENEDFSGVDYVFSWLGNVDLLLAIIKLIEDKKNAENDIIGVGVQLILLVEDSVRFYSSILPTLYKFLLRQSLIFSTEALNEHEQMLRMRGRPKVMLARNYEEAKELYDHFSKNMLGVITDVSFMKDGAKNSQAGIEFAKYLRENDPYLPIIVQSSEVQNRKTVENMKCTFLDKNSKKLPVDLGAAIMSDFGFGDFIIKNPATGEEILRIRDLKELQNHIFDIPAESLLYHASYNDISRWLYSRAMFPIAEIIKAHRFRDINEAPAVRQLFFDLIVKYRKMKNRGVVAIFHRNRFDYYSNFARIGQGSLGGKGRGLAFIDNIIKHNPVCDDFEGVSISIPRSVVLCTDIFDEFMEHNALYPIALSDAPDEEILHRFLEAHLPERLVEDFYALFEVVDKPLAVRSSSLLEDSHYQPFAGIYSTYMIPQLTDKHAMLEMLGNAIKSVYASVFFRDSKAYMTATRNVIDQEKMAVIIQEVIGKDWNGFYFPSFSGVGRSLNYYPINHEQPEDGVVEVAVGLGKYIVDGGLALRFSPRHPESVLQTSTIDLALRDTQTRLYALDTQNIDEKFSVDDGFNIKKVRVQNFADTGALKFTVSTYDVNDMTLREGEYGIGRRVVTFNNMLKYDAFPLAKVLEFMLSKGESAMGRPVEIEFAGMVDAKGEMKGQIYWLQIRPIVDRREMLDENIMECTDDKLLLKTFTALGHGMMDNLYSVVYIRPENFSSLNNSEIAREIEKINSNFTAQERNYILVGPGRWGSSDTALGIPVKWAHISSAKLIVESALPGYRIEPSQGTHFFQNLTSFGVGYFTVDPSSGDGTVFDVAFLDSMPAEYESEMVRIVTFNKPLMVGINGKKGLGVVLKPDIE